MCVWSAGDGAHPLVIRLPNRVGEGVEPHPSDPRSGEDCRHVHGGCAEKVLVEEAAEARLRLEAASDPRRLDHLSVMREGGQRRHRRCRGEAAGRKRRRARIPVELLAGGGLLASGQVGSYATVFLCFRRIPGCWVREVGGMHIYYIGHRG